MGSITDPADLIAPHPVDLIQKSDVSQSKLKLDVHEVSSWLEYGSAGVRPFLNLDMVRVILASTDPALTEVQEKVRAACSITALERDVFILAKRAAREGQLEFDPDAPISLGDDNGAYVGAFHWVDFTGTPLDEELEPEADPIDPATPRDRG